MNNFLEIFHFLRGNMLKSTFRLFLFLLIPCSAMCAPYDPYEKDQINIITYNIQTHPFKTDKEQTEKFLRDNAANLKELFNNSPDIVNLQEVPQSGIQWLEQQFGEQYGIIYAAKRKRDSIEKINDYTATLYKKSRFQTITQKNANPSIKTLYFSDNQGEFFLQVLLNDLQTKKQFLIVNAHISGGFNRQKGDKQIQEIIQLTNKYPYAIMAANINAISNEKRVQALKKGGFTLDPVQGSTEPRKQRKMDHVLFKAAQGSHFLPEKCQILRNIKGSDHYPLSCQILL